MADVSRTVEILFKGEDEVSPAITKVEQTLTGIGESAGDATEGVDKLTDELDDLGSGVEAAELLGAAFAALAIYLGKQVAEAFIDANLAADKFRSTIEFTTGSAETAAAEWDYITDTALRFGTALGPTADAYASFTNQIKGSAIEGEAARKAFEAVAGAIAATDGDSAALNSTLRQLGQGISKTRFSTEDLRGVVREMPGGLQGFADALGISVAGVYELTEAGKIGTAEMVKYLEVIGQQVDAFDFSQSLSGAFNNLQTGIDRVAVAIGDLGVKDFIRDVVVIAESAINAVAGGLEFLDDINIFDDLAESILTLVDPTGGLLVRFFNLWRDNGDAPKKALEGVKEELEFISVGHERATHLARDYNAEAAASQAAFEATRVSAQKLQEVEPYEKMVKSATKAAEQTVETRLELEKIASNERIRLIEARVTLDVANVEANARVAVATIEGLSATIESTGNVLSDLFGALAGAENLRTEFAIEDQIKRENEIREETLALQKRQAEAQIKIAEARAKALRSGNAVIEIDGAGLQPQLEAFMYEILKSLQVSVNADGYEMLLGTGA